MTKPLAVVGYIGPNTNLLNATSLIATEVAGMARILEKLGYKVSIATPAYQGGSSQKYWTGFVPWDCVEKPEITWLHQATPNFPGGICQKRHDRLEIVSKAVSQSDLILRLVVDNNSNLDFRQIKHLKNKKNVPDFCRTLVDDMYTKIENGNFYEVGWEDCRSADKQKLPFLESGITAEQLIVTKKILGGSQEKQFDFCYAGSRRGDKQQEGREKSLAPFLSHEPSFYKGTLFGKRSTFNCCWDAMAQSRGHLIVREKSMEHTPLHRYLQALILNAIPIVLGEPEPVKFIKNEILQNTLRVGTLDEGLALLERAEELRPLLDEELQHWIDYDLSRLLKLP